MIEFLKFINYFSLLLQQNYKISRKDVRVKVELPYFKTIHLFQFLTKSE
jgi:hypothetical protein